MLNRKDQLNLWIKEKPQDPFLWYALATEYISEGDDGDAEKIFSKLIKDHPNYHPTYYHLGQLYERAGKDDAAISIYKKGMEVCQQLGEQHAFNELRSVLEELEF